MTVPPGKAAPALALILAVSTGASVQDGGWTHSMTIHSANIPGIPGMLIPKGQQRAYRSCLAAADATHNPGVLLVGEKVTCTPRRFAMTDGRIASLAICVDKRLGTQMTVTSTGSYTATSYALRSVSTGTRKGRPLRIETSSTGKRTHRC